MKTIVLEEGHSDILKQVLQNAGPDNALTIPNIRLILKIIDKLEALDDTFELSLEDNEFEYAYVRYMQPAQFAVARPEFVTLADAFELAKTV